MHRRGYRDDIHSPVIPVCDAVIQPYFHFYTESKIRNFLCSSKGVIPVLDVCSLSDGVIPALDAGI
ncbi:hypothetical protein [Wolbachia endosymbiont of Ctenocephalides felis wCfeJ]|uniref:hypothetical protein n=1 Tax=Wolbachia endosymbiont of Ctenocephalides felis wCfeJ TaxID=2732594 RepID=UPI001446D619|nr:hypothetical protein [Wolbachia endosymbiont of Ctenocephalides felis wCfeJ]